MNLNERQKAIDAVDDLARGSERAFVEEVELTQDPFQRVVVGVKYLTLQQDFVDIRHALVGEDDAPCEIVLGQFNPLRQQGLGELLQEHVDTNPQFGLMIDSARFNGTDLLLQLLDGGNTRIPEIRRGFASGKTMPQVTSTILGLPLKVDELSRLSIVVPGQ